MYFCLFPIIRKYSSLQHMINNITYRTYENERISIKKDSLPYLKYELRLSCVVHGPIYVRFMGFYVNSFLHI